MSESNERIYAVVSDMEANLATAVLEAESAMFHAHQAFRALNRAGFWANSATLCIGRQHVLAAVNTVDQTVLAWLSDMVKADRITRVQKAEIWDAIEESCDRDLTYADSGD